MENPVVSVCMITYNHESYIHEAIKGILIQKTNFPFELVIGEDCSTDNTRKIIREYEIQYPEIIIAQYPETNRGMIENFTTVMESARGKYIALCEGDDYWTDPLKLQKQVDFLESNPDYVLCFHDAETICEDETVINWSFKKKYSRIYNKQDAFSFDDIIRNGWFIPTASIVFRNIIKEFPEWFNNVLSGDYSLQMLLARKGKFKYIDELMSIYRLHKSNSRSLFNDLSLNLVNINQTTILLNTVTGWHKGKFYKSLFFLHKLRVKLLYRDSNKISLRLVTETIKYFFMAAIYYILFYHKYRH